MSRHLANHQELCRSSTMHSYHYPLRKQIKYVSAIVKIYVPRFHARPTSPPLSLSDELKVVYQETNLDTATLVLTRKQTVQIAIPF